MDINGSPTTLPSVEPEFVIWTNRFRLACRDPWVETQHPVDHWMWVKKKMTDRDMDGSPLMWLTKK